MATPLSADRLVAALRAEGISVHEHSGWRTHNRAGHGAWGPVNGVLIHHTAGHGDREVCYDGRSDLPGPLCHAWLGKTDGFWMIGNGRANHAGKADSRVLAQVANESYGTRPVAPGPGDVDGNAVYYGLEIENLGNGKDPYPSKQYDTAVRFAAAICRAHGWGAKSVIGHKESTSQKIDPSFDMPTFRAHVAERLAHPANWNPKEEDMPLSADDIAKVWKSDILTSAPEAAARGNETVTPETWFTYLGARVREIKAEVADLRKALPTGGVDTEALADLVVEKIAQRLDR